MSGARQPSVKQVAKASGHAQIIQAGRDIHFYRSGRLALVLVFFYVLLAGGDQGGPPDVYAVESEAVRLTNKSAGHARCVVYRERPNRSLLDGCEQGDSR
ncbi:hypothetical protein FCH28_08945 [Streptomyces piniterrae]|uniref:Uncharacterized protein n=1 Tax=Streptomyces piniterrae TaxID=2571125 RepID=A0A4U0NM52_9ACTN|nr:hypothetical protein [Streptomyces piniterrae]TJZ55476.1 hypothetical protein FCH28_08945 [Streptomyces piniterrae]